MNSEQPSWRAIAAKVRAQVRQRVPAGDVDDVTQEALMRIYRGLGAVRDNRAIVGWIATVVGGAIADHHRAQRLSPTLEADEAEEPTPLAVLVPFVDPFIDLVPEPYRSAVRLVDLTQARQVEVARQLGVPLPTLKSRVQRGRAMLRDELERCCRIDVDQTGVRDVVPRARLLARGSRAKRRSR